MRANKRQAGTLNFENEKIVCNLNNDRFIHCLEGEHAEELLHLLEDYFENDDCVEYTHIKSNSDFVETQIITLSGSEFPEYAEALAYYNNGYNVIIYVGEPLELAVRYAVSSRDGRLVAEER